MTILSFFADLILETIAAVAPYRTFFTTVTAITAALIAAGAFWVHTSALPKEKWLRYFGFGFTIFAAQYAIPSLYRIYWLLFPQPHTDPWALSLIAAVASSLNNVFFLAAARILMGRKNAFPWWSWTLGFLAASAGLLLQEISLWYQAPDALFSAFVLGSLGRALFTNISLHRRRGLAFVTFLVGSLYAGLTLLHALNPPLTEGNLWAGLNSAVDLSLGPLNLTPRHAIDTFLIAWALPLKISLALGGFVLVFRTLAVFSPKALGSSLRSVSVRGADFFIGEVFINTLGDHFQADKGVLCFRLPGLVDERVAWWEWHRLPKSSQSRHVWNLKKIPAARLPGLKDSPEGKVLASGEHYERLRVSAKDPFTSVSSAEEKIYPSKIVVPVTLRNTYVGCLSAEWNTEYAFTTTAVEQLRSLADFFAPAIDQRRRLASVYHLLEELQAFDLTLAGGYRGVAAELASIIHRTLAPLSVSLSLHVGFLPVWAVAGDSGSSSGNFGTQPSREVSEMLYSLSGLSSSKVTVRRALLQVKAVRIGTLSLAWPDSSSPDFKTRPVVFPDLALLRTVATFVSTFVLNASHIGLTDILNRLQIALNLVQSREGWFAQLEAAVVESDLLWMVVEHASGEPQGQDALLEIVHAQRAAMPLPDEPRPAIQLHTLPAPLRETWKLLVLPLPTTGATLWLGVANQRFQNEIAPNTQIDWSWHTFLTRLAATADSALSRLTSKEEVEKLQNQADQFQSLFASSADASTFFHECRNIARNFTFTVQSLQEAWELRLLTAHSTRSTSIERDISGLLISAKRLYGLTDALMQVRREGRQPACNLLKVVEAVQDIVQYVLDRDNVDFDFSGIDSGIFVNVPFYVTHQSILCLVSNSIDAIKSYGGSFIRLRTEEEAASVLCRVIDNGPGIPDNIQDKVFELGVSTKQGTGGKGLFFVRSLLEQNGAEVWLESSIPGRTVFLIRFPRALLKGKVYESEESTAR